MKLLLKIFIPLLVILVVVFAVTNHISIGIFQDTFIENKAYALSDHALREIKEIFDDEDFLEDPLGEKMQDKFKQLTSAIEDPSTFRFRIVNSANKIVFSDSKKEIGLLLEDVKDSQGIQKGFSDSELVSWDVASPDSNSADVGYGKYLDVVVPVRDSNGVVHFMLELHTATTGILAGVQQSIDRTAYFIVFAAVGIFLAFYILIQIFVASPIRKLTRAMDIIGKGNFEYQLPVMSGDEIGVLFRHFDAMKLQLKQSKEDLVKEKEGVERKVEERTHDLKVAKDEVSMGWMQIQKEKARLSASIQSLSLGFIMTDKENKIIVSNPVVAKIFGFEKLGWTLDDITSGIANKVDIKNTCTSSMLEKKIIEIKDISYKSKFLRIFIAPIVSDATEVIGSVILVEDITEAKVLERSRSEFFSIASHELRTPLTSIKGNTSLIKEYYAEKLDDKDLREMIDDIHESSVRLIAIVNDFLDMSRLEQGRIEFKKEVFDVVPVIEKIVYDLIKLADDKKIYLKFDQPAGVHPNVVADSARLKQVIYNLAGNAIKFTATGGVTIFIDEKNGMVNIHISDTGQGIPLTSQSLLFRKFQQAENNILTRDGTKGTGLGLYISKLMADGMGGSITLEKSEENVGSTFLLSLPLATEKDTEAINVVGKNQPVVAGVDPSQGNSASVSENSGPQIDKSGAVPSAHGDSSKS